jgi:hypothetical protein
MPLQRYILKCPSCGPVYGYSATELDGDEPVPVESDLVIEQQEFSSAAGPVTRCRCPRCGRWVAPDNVQPA